MYVDALVKGFDEMPETKPGVREALNDELVADGLDRLVEELRVKDPKYYQEVDRKNKQRIVRALEVIRSTGQPFSAFRNSAEARRPFEVIKIGLERPREELYHRINHRVDVMIEQGLLQEVEQVIAYKHTNALQTVGYKEIIGYLENEYDWEEGIRLLKRNTRRFAKRQLTWFKRDQSTQWFHPDQFQEIIAYLQSQILK
jgi:tRNA dimethylallyltransferase